MDMAVTHFPSRLLAEPRDLALEALAVYYRDHRDGLHRYACALVRNSDLAEDVVQQAFVNTIEATRDGARIANIEAWLRRCVRNLSMDHLRLEPCAPLSDCALPEGPDAAAETVAVRERWRAVERAADSLPPHFRAALLLAELRGLSHEEIAARLERSVGSVSQILCRARRHVREIVGTQRQ